MAMNDKKCMACNNTLEQQDSFYYCHSCNASLHEYLFKENIKTETLSRYRNAVYSFLLRRRKIDPNSKYDFIYYDRLSEEGVLISEEKNATVINIYDLLKSYPDTLLKRIDEVLINLISCYDEIGTFFPISHKSAEMLYCSSDNIDAEIAYLVNMMKTMGYIYYEVDSLDENVYRCQITLTGWQRIEELKTIKKEINQAFIAMKFGAQTQPIAEAFKSAISKSGYAPYKMDEIEHNNQIVPEMFYEIGRSKFVVVDVTVPNLGAYYEAGYAQALGKEVIVCCKRGEEASAHFDISQKNLILWDTYDDLEVKLMKRIESTVGKSI